MKQRNETDFEFRYELRKNATAKHSLCGEIQHL